MTKSRPITFRVGAFIIGVALALSLAACAEEPAASAAYSQDAIILDVRTPDEYAAGHLEGATLLDFSAGEVAAQIPSLDPDAEYLVYCRSGNRSGQASALMREAGFANVTDLGSLDKASSTTGLPVVTD